MSRPRFSGSIFWGLVFLALGALFLAHNLGYPIATWAVIVRYWPVLLIVWGLFKLADHFAMESGRRRAVLFSPGDVASIVLVIVLGSLVTLSSNMSPELGRLIDMGNIDVWDLTGNNFHFTEQHIMDAGPDSSIEIANRFGDVDVMPSQTDRITLDVQKTIRAANQNEADNLSAEFQFSIIREGSKFRIGNSGDRRVKASLIVHVPKRSQVFIENRNGKITIKDLTGNQRVTNRFGEIEARGISGSLTAQNQNGEVHVDGVSDSVTISSSFAPVTVANVGGTVKINGRNNKIDVDHVSKDLDVESAFQNIDIQDVRGAIRIKNRNGEISLRLSQPPIQDVSVSSEFGNVTIELPAGSSFSADAKNRFGEVYSDFPELRTTAQNSDRSLKGQVGTGGPSFKVDSRNGGVHFRKKG